MGVVCAATMGHRRLNRILRRQTPQLAPATKEQGPGGTVEIVRPHDISANKVQMMSCAWG